MEELQPVTPKRGRPKLFNSLWKVFGNFGNLIAPGSQRPLSQLYRDPGFSSSAPRYRYYDLEIPEFPVRDVTQTPGAARSLIEMRYFCPEIATGIDTICDDVWSSQDGDDQGFTVADTLNDNETPIDPRVKYVLDRLIAEVIGGVKLEVVPDRLLSFGDAFASLGIDVRKKRVESILFLPTWEIFRIESFRGTLHAFEQRRYLNSIHDDYNILLHPLICVHWRYRRDKLYGRSLFLESIKDWACLKDATEDLARATHSVGVNPNIHVMPPSYDVNQTKRYKLAYEERRDEKKIVTDFYMMCGGDVRKVGNNNPDLKALVDNVMFFRNRIIMRSRLPKWKFNIDSQGAKEIAGQPSLDHARRVNRLRQCITEGIKHICNVELALQGFSREQMQYRIVFPPLIVDPQKLPVSADETNSMGIDDNTPDKIENNKTNGHAKQAEDTDAREILKDME